MKIPPELDGLSKRDLVRIILAEREARKVLEARVVELERRLLAYENAHTPPSQQRHYPKREKKKNSKLGAPEGHKGVTREQAEPNSFETLSLDTCPYCGGELGESYKTVKKVIEDIPEPQPVVVTEFTVNHYFCKNCGKKVIPNHPGLPEHGRFGPNLQSEVALLKFEDRLPERKISSSIGRKYKLNISPATVLALLVRVAEKLSGFYEMIKQETKKASIINADETGAKVQGLKYWFWTFVSTNFTFFLFSRKREGKIIEEVLGKDFNGLLGCDGWKAYSTYVKKLQRCWAHLLREAEFLAEKHEGQARLLYKTLKKMFNKIKKITTETPSNTREKIHNKLLNELTSWTQTCKKYTELQKFTTTIENGIQHWLTCILHPEIEPTNNIAERALREFVIQRKITGTLRNEKGIKTTATIMTAIATWKQQGLNPCHMLRTTLSS